MWFGDEKRHGDAPPARKSCIAGQNIIRCSVEFREFGRMKTIQGPAIFLAQFAGDEAPFNNLEDIARWAAELGYKGVQIPSWDARLFDLKRAAESKTCCDEVRGLLSRHRLAAHPLSPHPPGPLLAPAAAYD